MHRHGPDCLEGPVTRNRLRWLALMAEDAGLPEGPSTPSSSQEGPTMRLELIERVKREIAAGVYDTPEKWDKALDRLLEKLQAE